MLGCDKKRTTEGLVTALMEGDGLVFKDA
jgi:hypothetical protein